jgi:hypothetical protein
MISGGFERFVGLEAVVLLDGKFRFMIHPFDPAAQNGSTSLEAIQQSLALGQDAI